MGLKLKRNPDNLRGRGRAEGTPLGGVGKPCYVLSVNASSGGFVAGVGLEPTTFRL